MSFEVIPTGRFEKELKRLVKKFPSLKQEFASLVKDLLDNPQLGIALGNNCFKIRLGIKSKGKGKSGGARAITYLYLENEVIYLLTVYDKSEKADLKSKELKEMIASLNLDEN